eukprot:4267-Heterococcus_DN1.PRE.3
MAGLAAVSAAVQTTDPRMRTGGRCPLKMFASAAAVSSRKGLLRCQHVSDRDIGQVGGQQLCKVALLMLNLLICGQADKQQPKLAAPLSEAQTSYLLVGRNHSIDKHTEQAQTASTAENAAAVGALPVLEWLQQQGVAFREDVMEMQQSTATCASASGLGLRSASGMTMLATPQHAKATSIFCAGCSTVAAHETA